MLVLAAVGGAAPGAAETAMARGDEVVAREGPGPGQAGIAVLRGNDRVQLVAERDGWSEIRLNDGRRAWVPSDEIARVAEGAAAPRSERTAHPTETHAAAAAAPPAASDASEASAELRREVARLRSVVDDLAASQAQHREPPAGGELPEGAVWVAGGLALAVGLLVGGAWERHRNRRQRSLRF